MLPSENRLKKKEDFEAVYRYGKASSIDNLAIRFKKNDQRETRIGVVVGINFSKKAVERNRIKRQIRAILKKTLPQMRPGWDVVIIVRKDKGAAATAIDSQKLREMTKNALNRANLIS